MQYIKLFAAIIVSVNLLPGCSGRTNAEDKDSSSSSSNKPATSPTGNAQFSCEIDGQHVSGGMIDDGMQQGNGYQSNVAYIVDVDQGKELLFYLSDPKSTNTQGVHTLRFAVPDKTGSSSFGPDENGWGIEVDILI